MKRFLIVIVVLAAIGSILAGILGVTATCAFAANKIKGSGNIITRTIDAPDFNSIDASRAVNVVIADNSSGKITIEADDNIMEYIVVKVNDGELDITFDKKVNNLTNITINVTVPDNGHINGLEASSAATIKCDHTLKSNNAKIDASSAATIEAIIEANTCEIEASSAATVKATVNATKCEAEASSASKIVLKGSADTFQADASSAAKINASDFVARNCNAGASSAGHVSVNCSEKLIAHASSGASVKYSGGCTNVTINKSSGGSVSK